jgi:hypothetical protein
LAEYIYRNLPFAGHIALMGLEITGFTRPNLGELWVDPYDYQGVLQAAIEYLAIRGMNVSVYNHPFCVLPLPLWKFALKHRRRTRFPLAAILTANSSAKSVLHEPAVPSIKILSFASSPRSVAC